MYTSNQPKTFSEEEIMELMRLRMHPLTGTGCEENHYLQQDNAPLPINQRTEFFSIPERISFKQHVQPILERLCEMECIDERYLNHAVLIKMATIPQRADGQSYPYTMLRKNVYNTILLSGHHLPPFYTHVLSQWANGEFMNDYFK